MTCIVAPSVIKGTPYLGNHKRVSRYPRMPFSEKSIRRATGPMLGSPYDTNPGLHPVQEAKARRSAQDVREVPNNDAWTIPSSAPGDRTGSWSMDGRDEGYDDLYGLWSLSSGLAKQDDLGPSTWGP